MPFPSERVHVWARFDYFFEEEHERLFKALYFVAGNRHDAEELMQDAFLKLWERWGDARPTTSNTPRWPDVTILNVVIDRRVQRRSSHAAR